MKKKEPSETFQDIIGQSIDFTITRFSKLLPIILVTFIAIIIRSLFEELRNSEAIGYLYGWDILGMIILLIIIVIVSVWIEIVVILMIADYKKGKDQKLRELFEQGKKKLWALILTNLIKGIVLIFWYILLIIPGVIHTVYYAFSSQVLVIENKSLTDALEGSKEIIKGKWWLVATLLLILEVLNLGLVLGVPVIIGSFPNIVFLISVIVGLFLSIITLFSTIAVSFAYFELVEKQK